MSETENDYQLTAKDIADLKLLGDTDGDAPKRTLLEVWREVLSNIEDSRDTRVGPAAANRIIGSWPKMTYGDIPHYHARYHDLLLEMRDILHAEIDAHPDALENIDDDAEDNRDRYINLLFEWQKKVIDWELAWDPADPNAAAELAAIADATAFYLGGMGLVDHLTQIKFVFDEDAQAEMVQRLEAYRKEASGE